MAGLIAGIMLYKLSPMLPPPVGEALALLRGLLPVALPWSWAATTCTAEAGGCGHAAVCGHAAATACR